MYKYIVWHDNDYDLALWLLESSVLKNENVEIRCIPKTNFYNQIIEYFRDEITRPIMPFIRFETPDLIIQQVEPENKVLCVTELMTHTPQWQHPAQRFTRLYTSTILKIPTALILPEYKVKWEKGSNTFYKKTQYHCSGSVYNLFYQATLKNNNPTLLYHWPNLEGYLKYDVKHPTSPFIEGDIIKWFDFVNKCIKKNGVLDKDDYFEQLDLICRNKEEVSIEEFETIEGIVETKDFIKKYNLNVDKLDSNFLNNSKTLVFKPNGLVCTSSKFRTDPYAGMLCAFDVIFCRNDRFERDVNLVLVAKGVHLDEINYIENNHDDSECCFMNVKQELALNHLISCSYTQPKYRRIYGEISDLVIFEDEIIMKKGDKI